MLNEKDDLITINLLKEVKPGIFSYAVPSLQIEGRSHQPLLDACRKIKSILTDPKDQIATLYRNDKPCLTCKVEIGANLTVAEPSKGSPHFAKFQPFKGL